MSREMKNSKIDWIQYLPKTWTVKRIKYVAKSKSGKEIRKEDILDDGEFKVFGGGEQIGFIDKSNTQKEDILIGRVGSCGKVTVPDEKVWATDNAIVLSSTDCNYEYLAYCLKSMPLENLIKQTAQPLLTASSLMNCYIPSPTLNEQNQIVYYLNSKCAVIDQAIQKQKDIVIKLKEYKQSIITKAVTKGLNPNVKMKDNDIDWIREIPESWDIIPLKVLFKENKRRNTDLTNSNLLSLSYGRIIQKDIDSNFGLLPDNFSKYTIVNDGDIVLRLTDLQNDHKSLRTGLVTQSGIITSAYVTLTPKKELCSRYFHYLLHSYDIQKVFYTMGEGIRQNLSYDELSKNIRLVMPSLKEQQSIANYLDSKCLAIDESIKRSNKIIQKLEEYKKSLIYNAVTGKIDCRGEV